jgi:predicted  nucleic acid-binding Zn-ribbon protein
MGPTNLALVNLFQADQQLREAQARLDAASKNVRIQERRVHDLQERKKAGEAQVKSLHAKSMAFDADLKGRDAKIEKHRAQQANAKNNKEYQAFLVEINTGKVDRAKVEEDALALVAKVEAQQTELVAINQQLEAEQTKLTEIKGSISEKLAALNAEIEAVRPARDAAAAEVAKLSPKALQVYERLADRYDGEAVAPINKPDPRRENYGCTACNLELVTDIFNKLRTRDDLVFCPNCGRILYVPTDMAHGQPAAKTKSPGTRAATTRKTTVAKEASMPVDPVKAELDRLLRRASNESTRNAVAAGNNPVEFEVFIEKKFLGIYKGQNIDNFRRTARFCLQEAGVIKDMDVYEKGQGPKPAPKPRAAAPADTSSEAPSDSAPSAEVPTENSNVGGAPIEAAANDSSQDLATTAPTTESS